MRSYNSGEARFAVERSCDAKVKVMTQGWAKLFFVGTIMHSDKKNELVNSNFFTFEFVYAFKNN